MSEASFSMSSFSSGDEHGSPAKQVMSALKTTEDSPIVKTRQVISRKNDFTGSLKPIKRDSAPLNLTGLNVKTPGLQRKKTLNLAIKAHARTDEVNAYKLIQPKKKSDMDLSALSCNTASKRGL